MNRQSPGKYIYILITFLFIFSACQNQTERLRPRIDLSGEWQFSLDTENAGIREKWYAVDLHDLVDLPGTTDSNQKGFLNADTTTLHLNRVYTYEGPAWYRKRVVIPEEFRDKRVVLVLERTKPSKVWFNEHYIGESHLLQSPQEYDVSDYAVPGEHTISIRIDNDLTLTPYGNVHIYADETQTNWNGIIGELFLEAMPRTYISDLQVLPDIENKSILVELSIENGLSLPTIDVELSVTRFRNGRETQLKPLRETLSSDSLIRIEYALGDAMLLWDDYRQPLYQLIATIRNGTATDRKRVTFGMRKFAANGKQFTINGRTTFLRGKHDACVFPLTGHPPMHVEGWKRIFEIAKSYGINHYRFHSYSPPRAAFEAADQTGIFLQPELPFWGGLESDTVAARLRDEGLAMLRNYANHPSFVLFGAGNEIWSGHERVERIIGELKAYDNRMLYTLGANNNIGYVGPGESSDFHIAARTPYERDTTLTHTRLTHAFVDSREGGILNTHTPSTMINFDYPVAQIQMPLVSHEIGQYQIYPDYREIEKYTGVVKAWNLEIFRGRLKDADMLDQNPDFQKASGAWSALCYKAEMEAALRTEHLAGFQLLDLQDFPGQGTALVGILDAFMDSKEVITRESWLRSCNDVVLLLEFPKYCWQADEYFEANLKVANYSDRTVTGDVEWEIVDSRGTIIASGIFPAAEILQGGLREIGAVSSTLGIVEKAEKLTVNLRFQNYSNTYPIWIYSTSDPDIDPGEIIIAEEIDDELIAGLESGNKVLLFPTAESVMEKSVGGLFPPDFWNYGMFKGISERADKPVSPGTLGILTDATHPVFNSFPTEFHTNWQWFSIVKASRPLMLNATPHDYRPIVQVIDNLERNNKLGLIFEFSVGKGKLLICMSRLQDIRDRPEANQLYASIIEYMNSGNFNPKHSADGKLLYELF